jgi:hypothetical protein
MDLRRIVKGMAKHLASEGFELQGGYKLVKVTPEGWAWLIDFWGVGVKVRKLRGRFAAVMSVHAPEAWTLSGRGGRRDFLHRLHHAGPGCVASKAPHFSHAEGAALWHRHMRPLDDILADLKRLWASQGRRFFKRYGNRRSVLDVWRRTRRLPGLHSGQAAMRAAALFAADASFRDCDVALDFAGEIYAAEGSAFRSEYVSDTRKRIARLRSRRPTQAGSKRPPRRRDVVPVTRTR